MIGWNYSINHNTSSTYRISRECVGGQSVGAAINNNLRIWGSYEYKVKIVKNCCIYFYLAKKKNNDNCRHLLISIETSVFQVSIYSKYIHTLLLEILSITVYAATCKRLTGLYSALCFYLFCCHFWWQYQWLKEIRSNPQIVDIISLSSR